MVKLDFIQVRERYILEAKKQKQQLTLVVCMEELAELQQALSKQIRLKGDYENICEEIADVIICIEKVIENLDINPNHIMNWKNKKIIRLEKK